MIVFVVALLVANTAKAQDIMITTDGKSIKVKVLEINDQEIKYKEFDNLEGPAYVIKKSDINMIVYQNGKVESFQPVNPNSNQNTNDQSNYNQNTNNPNINVNLPKLLTYDELMVMNDDEKEAYLSTIGVNSIYEKYMSGNELAHKGRRLRFTGIGLSIGGAACYSIGVFISNFREDEAFMLAILGSTVFTVGQVLTVVSIPISVVGGVKKYSAENMYNDFSLGKNFTYIHPKLNFGLTQNGVGLSFKF